MIIGLTPVRNESWVLRYSARTTLAVVDHLVLFCHACSDDTVAIAEQLRAETGRVTVMVEQNPAWLEATFRQRMLEVGRQLGGTIFLIIDADEIITANLVPTIRTTLEALEPAHLLELAWLDLWRDLDHYRVACRTAPFAFRDRADVYWGPRPDGYQLHQRNPHPIFWSSKRADAKSGGVMHLQRVVWRRAQARQARYKMNEAVDWPVRRGGINEIEQRHHRSIDEAGLVLAPVQQAWWEHGIDRSLIDLDVEPWEIGEVKRLVAEHGRRKFDGLSLYGIA